MRFRRFVVLLLLNTAPCAIFCAPDSKHHVDKEAFLIRRIAEFWKDGDYHIVKQQIHAFLEQYPKSSLTEYLWGILGDLHLQESDYKNALNAYEKITGKDAYEKIILNKLQCYYESNDYVALANEGRDFLDAEVDFGDREHEYSFLMAEGYFRQISPDMDETLAQGLAHRAMPLYEALIGTEYDKSASFALAETYRILKQHEKGADLYNSLAQKYPNKEELLLFNAALLQVDRDKSKAIALFDKVIEREGEKEGDARYNRLLLYFQSGEYDKVIEEQLAVYPHVADEHMPSFQFIIAKSYYLLEQYENSLTPLKKYLLSKPEKSKQHKDALLISMSIASKISDEALFEKSFDQFKKDYPNDEQLGKAYFLLAMLNKAKDDFVLAESNLRFSLENYPDFDDKENLLYELGVACHHNGSWETAYSIFKDFLKDYPKTDREEFVWRYFLSSAIHLSKESEDTYSKKQFLADLSLVLDEGKGLSDQELREYRLLFAKMAYEIEAYSEALETLSLYIASYPGHESVAEAHLITALCFNRLQDNLQAFCKHLETAVKLNPTTYDNSSIHLQLFNGYLCLNEKNQEAELLDLAAQHLYLAFQQGPDLIQTSNKLWLAGHFFEKIQKSSADDYFADPSSAHNLAQAAEVYHSVFGEQKDISPDTESELIKYVTLLGLYGKTDSKISLLEHLVEKQASSLDAWKFRRQALFELASCYEAKKQITSALKLYDTIIQEAGQTNTPLVCASELKMAQMKFAQINEDEKNEKNPDVLSILNTLKDLQIKKHIDSEPAHLESALTYAQIRAQMSPDARKESRYLFFLVRMKENYSQTPDPIMESYYSALANDHKKKNLHENYMQFVDAEIARMQGVIKRHEGNIADSEKLIKKAAMLYQELLKRGNLNPELGSRLSIAMKSLEPEK